jgi:hypothetical protein
MSIFMDCIGSLIISSSSSSSTSKIGILTGAG